MKSKLWPAAMNGLFIPPNMFETGSHVGMKVIPFNIQIMHKPESSDEKVVELDA